MRSFDWAETPIGPVSSWSQALRTMVGLVLKNKFPILVWWGSNYVQFYNDAFRIIMGDKHPRAMGESGPVCWAEIWDIVGPLAEAPLMGREATSNDDLAVLVHRRGFLEEAHFKLAYSPVPDETVEGIGIGGVIATVAEITDQIYGARQMRMLRELGAHLVEVKTPDMVCASTTRILQGNSADAPFALVYLLDSTGLVANLAAAGGFVDGDSRLLPTLDVSRDTGEWPASEVIATRKSIVVENLGRRFPAMPSGPWAISPHSAVLLPLESPDQPRPYGILVLGLNPHRSFDDGYRSFCDLVATQVVTALRNVFAYQEEQARAVALAALDQAKTAFFANISHEFRTPLTLMLGPLEELAARDDLSSAARPALDLAYRNAQRLLKLVNALLDFSRVEGKRVSALFRPTDLAVRVCDLAGTFRSTVEKSGLRLLVECEPSSELVYVDADLFEKIVLNLMSNAFKFTWSGEIAIVLRYGDGRARLSVRDTGIGIPEQELPLIFQRFHRVEGGHGRSFEGTGIGLALVKDLVQLHGGETTVESVVGVGSTFTVTFLLGTAHLPRAEVVKTTSNPSPARAQVYVDEALHWLPRTTYEAPTPGPATGSDRSRILVADDNVDMRQYLHHLLSPHYEVELVANGRLALGAATTRTPDLVLTDVMMPELDGFALLAALRADERTRAVPVVMLSARAGEDASVEGLRAGADDYLIKPFTASELLVRIASNLRLVGMRRDLTRADERACNEAARGLALAEHNLELERLNAELEQFAHISSHDLREPLRMVTQYMGLLDRDIGAGLSAQNRQHLAYAVEGAKTIQALITDLLEYTRVSQSAASFAPVDLNLVMADVLSRVKSLCDATAAVIDLRPLPTVPGVQGDLALTFRHLVENALKFRSSVPPRIAIWADDHGDTWDIHIRDNGIGVDPAFHARIFKIFQRLHARHLYPGTGVGLALCHQVIQRHGGKIVVSSESGKGATFTVTLPCTRRQPRPSLETTIVAAAVQQ